MIKEFSYTTNSGTRDRKVFVIRENAHYIEGLDLTLLTDDDVKTITDSYKDFVPVNDASGTKVVLEGFNPDWNKAYRSFAKCRVNR